MLGFQGDGVGALFAAAEEFCFVKVMLETPAETLMVKVFEDSEPESEANPVLESRSPHTVIE